MAATEATYTTVSTVMRPPRMAIVFRGYGNWRGWARVALRAACTTWAGGGHLLVPYDEKGAVSDPVLEAVHAFDPDHVVLLQASLADHEEVEPGVVDIRGSGGAVLQGEERASALAAGRSFPVPDPVGERAREVVAAVCTPFMTEFEARERHEIRAHIDAESDGSRPWDERDVIPRDATYAAVPRHWRSDVSLLAAALIGIEPHSERQRPDQEPPAGDLARYAHQSFGSNPPEELISSASTYTSGSVPTLFEVLDVGVTTVVQGHSRLAGAIVVGDTADDFSLAIAANRLRGFGLWVSTDMLADTSSAAGALLAPIGYRLRAAERVGNDVTLTSASLEGEALDEALQKLQAVLEQHALVPIKRPALSANGALDWTRKGLHTRVLSEKIGDEFTVPVERDDSGTSTMLTRFALPRPTHPALTRGLPAWYVDVEFTDSVMPTGRGIGPSALRAGRNPEATNVRSSWTGLSVIAQSYGFVPSGAVLSTAMSKPVLRDLGMFDWVRAMAASNGLRAQFSTPGQHAQLIAQRLGSREALTDLVTGPLNPVLNCFRNRAKLSGAKDSEGGDDPIVFLDRVPYLSFERMCSAAPAADRSDLREQVDHLCRVQLARRGLVLGCTECGRPSFVGVDDLAQAYRCLRCGASNHLEAARWRTGSEPSWYYDLHGSFRELLSTRGDVPLLAAASLRTGTRQYGDCAEVEFLDGEKRIAEVDLVAHADGRVIVVEAKAGGSLGAKAERGRSVAKLAKVADVLRADEVVLATPRETWPDSDAEALKAAMASADGRKRQVRSLTGLGG